MNTDRELTGERAPETWQARYEAGETGWDRGEASTALLHWIENGDLKPCRILVPGCGNGHEVIELASHGFDVTAIDFAAAPVNSLNNQLQARGLQANVVQQNIFAFEAAESFDAIYEQTCLCALNPRDREQYEDQLARSIRPQGRLFALFVQSGEMDSGPPFPCKVDEMRSLFHRSRWDWPAAQRETNHPAGLTEIAVVLQRKETS